MPRSASAGEAQIENVANGQGFGTDAPCKQVEMHRKLAIAIALMAVMLS